MDQLCRSASEPREAFGECGQLAGAFGPPTAPQSGSKLHALHALRDIRLPHCRAGKYAHPNPSRSEPGAEIALAGLIGGLGHSAVDELAGIVNEVVPLKRRAGVHFVGLDMEVAKDTLVTLELVI